MTTKALIKINIIKLEDIIINLKNNVIKINIYRGLEIFIIISTREESWILATIYNNKKIIISLYINMIILISRPKNYLKLFKDRDLVFKF